MLTKVRSLLGGKQKEPKGVGPKIAMPLLSSLAPLDPRAIVESASKLTGSRLKLVSTEGKSGVVEFLAGEITILAKQMGVPVPNDEALNAAKTSWMWQRPTDPLRDHVDHVVVTAFPVDDSLEHARLISDVCAAVVHATGGPGVYFGGARQVVPADLLQGFVEDDVPPIPIWVGMTISGPASSGPFSLATHGLSAFAHLEFEVLDSALSVGELRESILTLASYVLENDVHLRDGETIGPDAETHWTIQERPSRLVPGRRTLVIGIP